MAALPKPIGMKDVLHDYYAEASVLSADLEQPFREEVKPRAYVKLPEDGRYQYQKADPFQLQGIISYKSGYTQVAGHRSSKAGHGFTTLATSVLEGLNVLDVVTADRVVGQISTEHPIFGEGQVPKVTFLGTRFDNLRIGGHKVEVDRALDIIGPRPVGDVSYFDDKAVTSRVSQQYAHISNASGRPEWMDEEFPRDRPVINTNGEPGRFMNCSLVNGVKGAPGETFGHVIDLPHFGKIFLGELRVQRKPPEKPEEYETYKFTLHMIRVDMGCLAQGKGKAVSLDTNGQGKGG